MPTKPARTSSFSFHLLLHIEEKDHGAAALAVRETLSDTRLNGWGNANSRAEADGGFIADLDVIVKAQTQREAWAQLVDIFSEGPVTLSSARIAPPEKLDGDAS